MSEFTEKAKGLVDEFMGPDIESSDSLAGICPRCGRCPVCGKPWDRYGYGYPFRYPYPNWYSPWWERPVLTCSG